MLTNTTTRVTLAWCLELLHFCLSVHWETSSEGEETTSEQLSRGRETQAVETESGLASVLLGGEEPEACGGQ